MTLTSCLAYLLFGLMCHIGVRRIRIFVILYSDGLILFPSQGTLCGTKSVRRLSHSSGWRFHGAPTRDHPFLSRAHGRWVSLRSFSVDLRVAVYWAWQSVLLIIIFGDFVFSDECFEVEQQCQHVISEIEQVLGEPLQKYFWSLRATLQLKAVIIKAKPSVFIR